MEANQFALLLRELEGVRKELAARNRHAERTAEALETLARNFEDATRRNGGRSLLVELAR